MLAIRAVQNIPVGFTVPSFPEASRPRLRASNMRGALAIRWF